MALKEWNELPVSVRRSRHKLYDYIKSELEGESEDSSSDSTTVQTRNIHIDVNDGEEAVSGATVVIGEMSRTTGDAGGCNFADLTDGEHTVTVTKEGFSEKTEVINVSADATNFVISLTAE